MAFAPASQTFEPTAMNQPTVPAPTVNAPQPKDLPELDRLLTALPNATGAVIGAVVATESRDAFHRNSTELASAARTASRTPRMASTEPCMGPRTTGTIGVPVHGAPASG